MSALQPTIIIRNCTKADLPAVIAINEESMPEHYSLEFWQNHLKNWPFLFIVAEINKDIAGYCMGQLERNPNGQIEAHLMSMAVKPNYRLLGIGGRLLDTWIAICKQLNVFACFLEVRKSNTAAISLYVKRHFSFVKTLPRYYNNEDGHLMKLLINV
jgi:ribosomal-protein-alanine N-acetyltransferase